MIEQALVILRYAFLLLLYLFIFALFYVVVKDLSHARVAKSLSQSFSLVVRERGEFSKLELNQVFPVNEQMILGRYADNDIAIADPHVSAEHAVVRQERGTLYVADLGSTNGTFLNNKMIKGKKRLQPGDLLRIGDITFEVARWENENSSTI